MIVEFDWSDLDLLRKTAERHTDPSIRNLAAVLLKVVEAIEDEQDEQAEEGEA